MEEHGAADTMVRDQKTDYRLEGLARFERMRLTFGLFEASATRPTSSEPGSRFRDAAM